MRMRFFLRSVLVQPREEKSPMAEIKLEGEPKQRGMLYPVLGALVVLAILGGWFAKVYLHPAATGSISHVELFPVHTQYTRAGGMLVGADQTEDALYVIADVALTDKSEVPLFLKSINGSFTMNDGTVMQANVIDKNDLPRLMLMFPKLKPLADATSPAPLERESKVAVGSTGHGYVVLSYNVPKEVWDKRKSAEVTVDFYHQDPVSLPLPK
jgi:hypothetical protein